ncbi:MAG: SRPBCC family protein [Hyphomicrobium sp.]|jgi:uncharacterized protein YndB with AHSA1/START domain
MFKKILAAIVVVVAGFAGYVALQPDVLNVERQATIAAPPAAVFAQLNDLHKWESWSPWAKLDPNAKISFEGPAAGKDAVFIWSGNEKIGEGRMTIVDSRPDEYVDIMVAFTKPFEDTSSSTFELKPQAGKTLVTWRMRGEQNFLQKAFCVLMNGEEMLGGEMEKGLANLQAVAEAGATPTP